MNAFDTFVIGSKKLPNRLIMAPVKTAYGAVDGKVTPRHIAFYRRRAQGGIGAIMTEPLYVDIIGREHPKQLGIVSDEQIEGLTELVEAVHAEGSLAIAHLNHGGRAANPKASGHPTEAPSEVTCARTGIKPTAMTLERIQAVIGEFAEAAGRAVAAGFDIIELQFGLGYLVAQFLSPRTNLRQDEYGGSEENRFRFAKEVFRAIKEKVGSKVAIMIRIAASEQVEGGLNIEDAKALAKFVEEEGADAVHVASGTNCDSPPWYFQHMRLPADKNLEWAASIRQAVHIPVIVAGRMGDPEKIRTALREEKIDGVALGRPLLADPDLPRKMRENRDREIIQCGACLQGCLAKAQSGEGLACIVNPLAGNELEIIEQTAVPKKVVVVGGGPAGMQAALTARQRGHQVVLFDEGELGGQFRLATIPPGKEMLKKPLEGMIGQIKECEVDLRLNAQITADDVMKEVPDEVILATGAAPTTLAIPGLKDSLTAIDVLSDLVTVGKRVLIIGGGMIGLETAEFLAKKDHEVTVVEILDELAGDMFPITRNLTLKSLQKLNVRLLTGVKLKGFEENKAYIEKNGSESPLGEFDSVVMAVGTKSCNELLAPLQERGLQVHVVGDASKPANLFDAVRSGFEVGRSI